MRGETVTQDVLSQIVLESNVLGPKRRPTGPFDFGRDGIGLHVKRVMMTNLLQPESFGIYLGPHNGKYIIAHIDSGYNFTGGESFNSIEDLHKEWQLD